ncbi:MAG TPA: hypothetical protein VHO72_00075 [Bacteroidales bacterium]|nr:hypothetical protein [Bacteroidales bacterium]
MVSLNTFSVTKTALHAAELKKEIKEYIAAHYEDFEIRESYKVNSSGVILFEVTIVKGTERFLLIFDKEGVYVKRKVIAIPSNAKKMGLDKRKSDQITKNRKDK